MRKLRIVLKENKKILLKEFTGPYHNREFAVFKYLKDWIETNHREKWEDIQNNTNFNVGAPEPGDISQYERLSRLIITLNQNPIIQNIAGEEETAPFEKLVRNANGQAGKFFTYIAEPTTLAEAAPASPAAAPPAAAPPAAPPAAPAAPASPAAAAPAAPAAGPEAPAVRNIVNTLGALYRASILPFYLDEVNYNAQINAINNQYRSSLTNVNSRIESQLSKISPDTGNIFARGWNKLVGNKADDTAAKNIINEAVLLVANFIGRCIIMKESSDKYSVKFYRGELRVGTEGTPSSSPTTKPLTGAAGAGEPPATPATAAGGGEAPPTTAPEGGGGAGGGARPPAGTPIPVSTDLFSALSKSVPKWATAEIIRTLKSELGAAGYTLKESIKSSDSILDILLKEEMSLLLENSQAQKKEYYERRISQLSGRNKNKLKQNLEKIEAMIDGDYEKQLLRKNDLTALKSAIEKKRDKYKISDKDNVEPKPTSEEPASEEPAAGAGEAEAAGAAEAAGVKKGTSAHASLRANTFSKGLVKDNGKAGKQVDLKKFQGFVNSLNPPKGQKPLANKDAAVNIVRKFLSNYGIKLTEAQVIKVITNLISESRYQGKVLKEYREHIESKLVPYMQKQIGFNRPPVINFLDDAQNATDPMGKTAFYDPQSMEISVYTTGRHPKDIMRSVAHEVIHHAQNCRGQLDPQKMGEASEGYAQKNPYLRKLEEEAYLLGNMTFRDWEDGMKTNQLNEMHDCNKVHPNKSHAAYKRDDEAKEEKSLDEWKNEERWDLLMKRFGISEKKKAKNPDPYKT